MQNSKRTYPIKVLKSITRILPSLFWIVLILGFDSPAVGVLTVICALLHEAGHIISANIICRHVSLRASLIGFGLKPSENLSYTQELIIAACGPLTNILIFLLTLPFRYALRGYVFLFGMLNLLTAISNLIPLQGYDGYRIVECTILKYGKNERRIAYLSHISFFLLSLMCFFSLYLMEKLNTGYWIFFILIFSLLKSIKRNETVFLRANKRKKEFL